MKEGYRKETRVSWEKIRRDGCFDVSERCVSFVFLTKNINLEFKLQSEEYGLCRNELGFVDNIPEKLNKYDMHSGTGKIAETEVTDLCRAQMLRSPCGTI